MWLSHEQRLGSDRRFSNGMRLVYRQRPVVIVGQRRCVHGDTPVISPHCEGRMDGPEGMRVGGVVTRTPRPLAVSLSSEARQIRIYLALGRS